MTGDVTTASKTEYGVDRKNPDETSDAQRIGLPTFVAVRGFDFSNTAAGTSNHFSTFKN